MAWYRINGEAAFERRSRRPKVSPGAISDRAVELITGLRKDLPRDYCLRVLGDKKTASRRLFEFSI